MYKVIDQAGRAWGTFTLERDAENIAQRMRLAGVRRVIIVKLASRV